MLKSLRQQRNYPLGALHSRSQWSQLGWLLLGRD